MGYNPIAGVFGGSLFIVDNLYKSYKAFKYGEKPELLSLVVQGTGGFCWMIYGGLEGDIVVGTLNALFLASTGIQSVSLYKARNNDVN